MHFFIHIVCIYRYILVYTIYIQYTHLCLRRTSMCIHYLYTPYVYILHEHCKYGQYKIVYTCTGRMIYITAATQSPSAGNTNEEVGNNPFALHAGDMSFDELAKPASGLDSHQN